MAAHPPRMAVLPEQRGDALAFAIEIVVAVRRAAEVESLRGYGAQNAQAARSVSTPSVLPLTHVIYRCNRYGTYIRWMNHGSVRSAGPKPVRSQWGSIMQGRVEQIGGPVESCPVDSTEATETGRCILALPKDLRDAIIEEHVVGGTQQQKADALGIDRTTFWRRCQAAYPKLLELMNLAAAGLPLE